MINFKKYLTLPLIFLLLYCVDHKSQERERLERRAKTYLEIIYGETFYNPAIDREEAISIAARFLTPDPIGRARAEQYYSGREDIRGEYDRWLKSGWKGVYVKIDEIRFLNAELTEAAVDATIIQQGLYRRDGTPHISIMRDVAFEIVDGEWYRSSTAPVTPTKE